jgi:predicted HNH restriction endonuclease
MRNKKLVNKKNLKKVARKCFFCNVDDYALLDVHRIIPGEEGGVYSETNSLVVCSNCHRKIHDGQIKIDRRYPSTGGWVLHYWEGEKEKWV